MPQIAKPASADSLKEVVRERTGVLFPVALIVVREARLGCPAPPRKEICVK